MRKLDLLACSPIAPAGHLAGPSCWHDIFGRHSMFQKLYRHLEDISSAAKRQEESVALSQQWGAKISGQLDDIKVGFRQLEDMKEGLQQKPQSVPWKHFYAIGALLSVLLISVLVMFSIWIKNIRDNTQTALDRSADNGQASLVMFTQLKAAHEKTRVLETQVTSLDSLVRIQSQTIAELKKLNETAVRNLVHIHNDLQQINKQGAPSE